MNDYPKLIKGQGVSILYQGNVPSKSNFRFSRKDPLSRKKWARIKQFEKDFGYLALAAGARKAKGEVEVKIMLFNQRLDTDNATKIVCDSLENVCFYNDKQVSTISVGRTKKVGEGPSMRVEVREL